MKFGSLFAGIGGIDLGLERAGMECAWQVEIDDYCTRVLEKHWPNVKRYSDVRECGKQNLQPIDLIAGGFPCQPHSVAGKRRGAEDNRNLWPEFIRIIRETRPRYVLAENVPGIITTYIDTVLSDLESEEYTCATFNLPAVAFDAPHRRERISIVAHPRHSKSSGWRNTKDSGKGKKTKHETRGVATSCSSKENMADTESVRGASIKRDEPDRVLSQISDMADTNRTWELQPQGIEPNKRRWVSDGTWWGAEPDVGRVAHGVPSRVDRLRGLGNAVVPQVAEWIGRRIMEFDDR